MRYPLLNNWGHVFRFSFLLFDFWTLEVIRPLPIWLIEPNFRFPLSPTQQSSFVTSKMALTRSLRGCVPCWIRVTWSFCACAWQIQFVFSWERAVLELLLLTRLEQPPAKTGNQVNTKKSLLTYTSRRTLDLPWPTRGGYPEWVGTGPKNHARNRVCGTISFILSPTWERWHEANLSGF